MSQNSKWFVNKVGKSPEHPIQFIVGKLKPKNKITIHSTFSMSVHVCAVYTHPSLTLVDIIIVHAYLICVRTVCVKMRSQL